MGRAVELMRLDLSVAELCPAVKREENALVARRILAIALVLNGGDRRSAAEACGMDRQTLRDWVHHYNREITIAKVWRDLWNVARATAKVC